MAKTPAETTTTETPAAAAAVVQSGKFSILSVNATVPMPEKIPGKRGSKTQFPFDALTVGASFGLIGRDSKSMSSIVSAQNRKADNFTAKKDAAGNVIFKTQEMKSADGTVTTIPTSEPETVQMKEFFAIDTDPKLDPEGATVRIFRRR